MSNKELISKGKIISVNLSEEFLPTWKQFLILASRDETLHTINYIRIPSKAAMQSIIMRNLIKQYVDNHKNVI